MTESDIREDESDDLSLDDWQKELLNERLEDAERNPDGWLTWDEVKQRVFGD